MGMQVIDIEERSAAEPAAVYALLRDGAAWPTFSGLGSFELERPSDDGLPGEGLGAIRIFRTPQKIGPTIENHELIVEAEPDRRFAYELLSGLPLKGYRATTTLTPDGSGTRIHWRSTFTAKVPGTGWIYRRQLRRFIGELVEGLARAAERVHT